MLTKRTAATGNEIAERAVQRASARKDREFAFDCVCPAITSLSRSQYKKIDKRLKIIQMAVYSELRMDEK